MFKSVSHTVKVRNFFYMARHDQPMMFTQAERWMWECPTCGKRFLRDTYIETRQIQKLLLEVECPQCGRAAVVEIRYEMTEEELTVLAHTDEEVLRELNRLWLLLELA